MSGTFRNIDNIEHEPALAQALGNMLVAWAFAEYALVDTTRCVLGIDSNMAWVGYYRIPTFEARVKFIRALITEWDQPQDVKDKVDTAVEKLSKLSMTRNGWVHGDWCSNEDRSETVI